MANQLSDLWSLNNREKLKGLVLAVAGAVIGLIWSGLAPVVEVFTSTGVIDLDPFTSAINLSTIIQCAVVAGGSYLGITVASGKKSIK